MFCKLYSTIIIHQKRLRGAADKSGAPLGYDGSFLSRLEFLSRLGRFDLLKLGLNSGTNPAFLNSDQLAIASLLHLGDFCGTEVLGIEHNDVDCLVSETIRVDIFVSSPSGPLHLPLQVENIPRKRGCYHPKQMLRTDNEKRDHMVLLVRTSPHKKITPFRGVKNETNIKLYLWGSDETSVYFRSCFFVWRTYLNE